MNKFFIISIFLSFCFYHGFAQDKTFKPVVNQAATGEKIMEVNKNIETISCNFVQSKELSILAETIISEGIFKLKGDNKLLWEYRTPYPYKIIINGGRMEIDNSGSTMVFDTRSNRMFREISSIMIKSVDGTIINDNSSFDTKLFENDTEVLARLLPKTKELSSLFEKICLHFNKSNYIVSIIEMHEEQGDQTTIVLKNQKLNEAIEDSVFSINN